MNRCAIENVKADLLINKNRYKDSEREAIKDGRISSQIEMYHDMSEIYSILLEQLNSCNFDNCHNMTCKNKSRKIGYEKATNDSLRKVEHISNNFSELCKEWKECKGNSCLDCVLQHTIETIKEQLN